MLELESMAVEMPEVEGHPNRAAFRGVLTMVDVPSQRAPMGSKGRRVMLTRSAAEAALPSLLGMAVDYAPSFDRHDVKRKVGVITSAELVGRNLEVGGYLYRKDFPEIVEEISRAGRTPLVSSKFPLLAKAARSGAPQTPAPQILSSGNLKSVAKESRMKSELMAAVERIRSITRTIRAGAKGDTRISEMAAGSAALGMSFEVTDVMVADMRERVWKLLKVTFTGAAVLRRDKAAFGDTWIELS